MRHRLPVRLDGLAASLRPMPTAVSEGLEVLIRRSEHFESIHAKSGRQAQSDGLVFFAARPNRRLPYTAGRRKPLAAAFP